MRRKPLAHPSHALRLRRFIIREDDDDVGLCSEEDRTESEEEKEVMRLRLG